MAKKRIITKPSELKRFSARLVGNPKAKRRPAQTRKGVKEGEASRTYNPSAGDELFSYQDIFCQAMTQLPVTGFPFLLPLACTQQYVFPRPKAHFGTGRNAGKLKPSAPVFYHSQIPDIDNLMKLLFDAMNKKLFPDDGGIVYVPLALKRFSHPERPWEKNGMIYFTLYEIDPYDYEDLLMRADKLHLSHLPGLSHPL